MPSNLAITPKRIFHTGGKYKTNPEYLDAITHAVENKFEFVEVSKKG